MNENYKLALAEHLKLIKTVEESAINLFQIPDGFTYIIRVVDHSKDISSIHWSNELNERAIQSWMTNDEFIESTVYTNNNDLIPFSNSHIVYYPEKVDDVVEMIQADRDHIYVNKGFYDIDVALTLQAWIHANK